MILVVEDDLGWETYYRKLLRGFAGTEYYRDGLAAAARLDEVAPALIILDVLLTGPTGFALLNEIQSYPELAGVPVVVVSSVGVKRRDLREYGVVATFDKATMRPRELLALVEQYVGAGGEVGDGGA